MRGGAAGMMGSSIALLGVTAQIMVLAIIACLIMLLVGVCVLVLLHVCTVGRAFSAAARGGSMGGESRKDIVGLSSDELDELPCVDFAGEKCGAADCAVCLETFQPGERCRVLPRCSHCFHVLCADSWLSRAPVCPICRTMVMVARRRVGGGDDVRAEAGEWFDRRLAMDMRESRQVLIG